MDVIFVSREKVKNPYTVEMIKRGREIKEEGTISVRFGNRIIITTRYDLGDLGEDDFAEVVDFNITSNVSLVIGRKEPSIALPLHWMIYRLPNVNAIVHLHKTLPDKLDMDYVLKMLKNLKERKILEDALFGRIAIGFTLDEIII